MWEVMVETPMFQLGYSGSTKSCRKFKKEMQNWGEGGEAIRIQCWVCLA